MTYSNVTQAEAALKSVKSNPADLIEFVRQLSIDVVGLPSNAMTVLYSGKVGNISAWAIAEEMPENVRHIGRTVAAEVLDSEAFKAKVAQAFNIDPALFKFELLDEN